LQTAGGEGNCGEYDDYSRINLLKGKKGEVGKKIENKESRSVEKGVLCHVRQVCGRKGW